MAKKKQKSAKSGGLKDADVGGTKRRRKTRAKAKKEIVTDESPVEQYVHPNEKRKNNPPVGMVDSNNDPDQPSKRYSYDPRLDPQLQWSGKTENSEFDVDTVSLHVHERIEPLTIIEKVMKEHKQVQQSLFHYFEMPENNPPLRKAIEFYKHDQNWSNRLIAGDSLLVMNSLLEKEGMEEKVQMIYIDPPYGIKYGSNFQPFVNKRDVKDGKDEDLNQEPEMLKAFRDTWELGIHSYLSYMRDRLLLSRKILKSSGSLFVQIGEENIHHVRELLDEIFGPENFCRLISYVTTSFQADKILANTTNYLLWYAKDKDQIKIQKLFRSKKVGDDEAKEYKWMLMQDGDIITLTKEQMVGASPLPSGGKVFRYGPLTSQGYSEKGSKPFIFKGKSYSPGNNQHWKISIEGLETLVKKGLLVARRNSIAYFMFLDDFPITPLTNVWSDTKWGFDASEKSYVVQTNSKVVQRCLLMATEVGDLVLDPTCGSGTTAYVAEQWGRRWITCDTSRISITLAKQRMLTALFNQHNFAFPNEGLSGGFRYEKCPHITLGDIANDRTSKEEILYDKPQIENNKIRVTGPFTIESVPSPTVKSIDALSEEANQDTLQTKISTQQEWRDELLRTGIRTTKNQRLEFSRVESHPTTKWLHVDAETKEAKPKRVMISFGPEHSLLDQRQVEKAVQESKTLVPTPSIIIFVAMQFDPEAAKDIDNLKWPGVTILKAEMNKDLQTQDLKKKQSTNESFWLMGSPDVECKKQKDGKYIVTVNGFDYFNTKTNEIESGGASKIAMWELDTDYDDRSVYAQQVFFPLGGKSGGWNKLAKTLQAYIDEDLITKYQGIESIPFEAGPNKRVAVKIIDDRGIESLKIIDLE